MPGIHRSLRPIALFASLPIATSLAFAAGGCGSELEDEHPLAGRIEIETRGTPPALLGVWIENEGWEDAEGNPIDELPAPVHTEDQGLLPLRAGGDRASLTVRYFERDGSEIEMGTLSRDEETGERECTEHSARYFPSGDDTELIAWPNIQHPDSPDGAYQFAELESGEVVGIFHCDHIHIYPEGAGEVDVEFVLWHVDHADDIADAITLRIEPADD